MLRIFLLLLLLGFATAAQSASVTGKVSDDNAPVAGLRVAAYPVDALNFDKPHTISEATGEDGLFQLDLDEGQYYLLAQSEKLFSFYGRNPVSVPKAGLDKVNLLVLPQQPAQN
ncbi:MAG: hypothetical protein OET90_11630, partial [Desulfuromonadales bacterium]|nr:hypothetical protein [Desulfuromonadales bacterium]